MNIKKYYMNEFPSDELGTEINPSATFVGLDTVLANYGNVYEYLNVGDSLLRERVFEKLSNVLGVSYNQIYTQWLQAD